MRHSPVQDLVLPCAAQQQRRYEDHALVGSILVDVDLSISCPTRGLGSGFSGYNRELHD